MNFNGRWVPLEVMDTIILLWVIVAALLAFVLVRFARFRSPKNSHQGKPARNARKSHVPRRKP